MINDHSTIRNKRLKAAYVGGNLKPETKIPSIHKYKLSLDLKNSPDSARRKIKQASTRSGIKQSPESNLLLTSRGPNTSHRQLAGFFTNNGQKNISFGSESPYNSSNLLFNSKRQQKSKVSSLSMPNLQGGQFPMKGSEALRLKNESLSEYELREISHFEEVYFVGTNKNKIHGTVNDLN